MAKKSKGKLPAWLQVILLSWPVPNLWLVVEFWQSQIAHYIISTNGVLLTWLGAGFFFGCIMLFLQIRALVHTFPDTEKPRSERRKTLWLLTIQIVTLVVMTYYSITTMRLLLRLGVYPNSWADLVIGATSVGTLMVVLWKFGWHKLGKASTLVWLATGVKVTPQILQGVWFAVYGSAGMHIVTLGLVVMMTSCRYSMARTTLHYQRIDDNFAANKIAFYDLVAVSLMALGWVIGRIFLLSNQNVVSFVHKLTGTRDDPGFFLYTTISTRRQT